MDPEDLEDLHHNLVNEITSDQSLEDNPLMPRGLPQGGSPEEHVGNLNGPLRGFLGDRTVKQFGDMAADYYSKKMKEAGASDDFITANAEPLRGYASGKARQFALGKLENTGHMQDWARILTEKLPYAGDIAKMKDSSRFAAAEGAIRQGQGGIGHYLDLGEKIGKERLAGSRSTLEQIAHGVGDVGKFFTEVAMLGGVPGSASAPAVLAEAAGTRLGLVGTAQGLTGKVATGLANEGLWAASKQGLGQLAKVAGAKAAMAGMEGAALTAMRPVSIAARYAARGDSVPLYDDNGKPKVDEQGNIQFTPVGSKDSQHWKAVAEEFIDNSLMPGLAGAFTGGRGGYAARVAKKTAAAIMAGDLSEEVKYRAALAPEHSHLHQVVFGGPHGRMEALKGFMTQAAVMSIFEGVTQGMHGQHPADREAAAQKAKAAFERLITENPPPHPFATGVTPGTDPPSMLRMAAFRAQQEQAQRPISGMPLGEQEMAQGPRGAPGMRQDVRSEIQGPHGGMATDLEPSGQPNVPGGISGRGIQPVEGVGGVPGGVGGRPESELAGAASWHDNYRDEVARVYEATRRAGKSEEEARRVAHEVAQRKADKTGAQEWKNTGTKFEPSEKGGDEFTSKKGQKYRVQAQPIEVENENGSKGTGIRIASYDKEGNEVGRVLFDRRGEDRGGHKTDLDYTAGGLRVNDEHQGQGIAEAMYDYAHGLLAEEKANGSPLQGRILPSNDQTSTKLEGGKRGGGKNIWQRNAEKFVEKSKSEPGQRPAKENVAQEEKNATLAQPEKPTEETSERATERDSGLGPDGSPGGVRPVPEAQAAEQAPKQSLKERMLARGRAEGKPTTLPLRGLNAPPQPPPPPPGTSGGTVDTSRRIRMEAAALQSQHGGGLSKKQATDQATRNLLADIGIVRQREKGINVQPTERDRQEFRRLEKESKQEEANEQWTPEEIQQLTGELKDGIANFANQRGERGQTPLRHKAEQFVQEGFQAGLAHAEQGVGAPAPENPEAPTAAGVPGAAGNELENQRLTKVLESFQKKRDAAQKELERAFPSGVYEQQGAKDRKAVVDDYDAKIAEIKKRLGEAPSTEPVGTVTGKADITGAEEGGVVEQRITPLKDLIDGGRKELLRLGAKEGLLDAIEKAVLSGRPAPIKWDTAGKSQKAKDQLEVLREWVGHLKESTGDSSQLTNEQGIGSAIGRFFSGEAGSSTPEHAAALPLLAPAVAAKAAAQLLHLDRIEEVIDSSRKWLSGAVAKLGKTPRFSQKEESPIHMGFSVRGLDGKEFGLFKTLEESKAAAAKMNSAPERAKDENEFTPAEVYGDRHPSGRVPSTATLDEDQLPIEQRDIKSAADLSAEIDKDATAKGLSPTTSSGIAGAVMRFVAEDTGSSTPEHAAALPLLAPAVAAKAATLWINDERLQKYYQGLAGKMVRVTRGIADNVAELSGKMFPSITRASRLAAEALSRHISAPIYSRMASARYIDKILGPNVTPDERRELGAAFQEMRHRYAADQLNQESERLFQAAAAKKQAATQATGQEQLELLNEYQKLFGKANDMMQRRSHIKSFVGDDFENSPIRDEQHYRELRQKLEPILERYKEFSNILDANYRKYKGMEADDEFDSLTQIPGLTMNAKPIYEEQEANNKTIFSKGARGNLKNVQHGKLSFDQKATLAAPAYDTDFAAIIENSLTKSTNAATKAEAIRQAVTDGVAQWGKQGQRIAGYKEVPFVRPPKGIQENEGQPSLFVQEGAYPEYRKALEVDQPARIPYFTPFLEKLNRLSLASTIEAAAHTTNQITAFTKPGFNPAMPFSYALRLAAQGTAEAIEKTKALHPFTPVAEVLKRFANAGELQDRLIDLARIGAQKEHGVGDGAFYNPLLWTRRFLDVVNDSMRLTMEDAFKRNVKIGRYEGTETEKRDWINQLGQYNKRAQNQAVILATDLGIGPFAKAGTNYAMQGLRALIGDPGVKATSMRQDVSMRAEFLGKVAALVGGAALYNLARWGRWDGDDNTPMFAMKLWDNGKGQTAYVDPTNIFTPFKRGLRETGLLALGEGARRGEDIHRSADKAVESAMESFAHPFLGPGMQFLVTSATGKDLHGYQKAEKAGFDESQTVKNFAAAIGQANPLLQTTAGPALEAVGGTEARDYLKAFEGQSREKQGLERFSQLYGPLGVQVRAPRASPEVSNLRDALAHLEDKFREDARSAIKSGGKVHVSPELHVLRAAETIVNNMDRAVNRPGASDEYRADILKRQAEVAKRAFARFQELRKRRQLAGAAS